jgi:beta-galactosidase
VRLWSWEALAHGAEVVSYFRWRQAPFAQEQMHAGLNLPGSDELSAGGREAEIVGREIIETGELPATEQAPVAIVYDYETYWATVIQPQGRDFQYHDLAFRWYEAVRKLGLNVDFVPPGAALDGYKLVLVPSLMMVSEAALQAFNAAECIVLYGPRSGSRTRQFAIPENLPPGPLAALTGNRLTQVSSLRPGLEDAVSGTVSGAAIRWREYVETDGEVLAKFANGDPALTAKDGHHYLACWPDQELLRQTLTHLAAKAGLETVALPDHIRLRRRGGVTFAFNYGTEVWAIPAGANVVLGEAEVKPQAVTAWKE